MLPTLLAAIVCAPGRAQGELQEALQREIAEPTAPAIEARITAIGQVQGMAEDARAAVLDAYQQALAAARRTESLTVDLQRYEDGIQSAATDLASVRATLAEHGAPEPPAPDAPLAALEQSLADITTLQRSARTEVGELDAEISRRVTRRGEIPGRSAQARQQLEDLTRQLEAPPREGASTYLSAAQRTLALARRAELTLELRALEREVAYYQATQELLEVRRELATLRASSATPVLESVQAQVTARRLEEARQQEEQAVQAAEQARAQPLLQAIALENAQLAQKRTQLTSDLARARTELQELDTRLAGLKADFESTMARVTEVGRTPAIAQLLRQRKSQIAASGWQVPRRARTREEETNDARLELFDLEDRRRALDDIPRLVRQLLDGRDPPILDAEERDRLAAELTLSLQDRDSIVGALYSEYEEYHEILVSIDSAERLIANTSREYLRFVNEKVLWIRGAPPLWRTDGSDWLQASAWLTAPGNWALIGPATMEGLSAEPAIVFLVILAMVVLLLRSRLRRQLELDGTAAARGSNVSLAPSIRAMLATLVIALPFPLLLWAWSRSLLAAGDPGFPTAVGYGVARAGTILAGLEALRQTVRRGGLGQAHFRWNQAALSLLGRHVFWLTCITVPAGFVVGMFEQQGNLPWTGTMGRLALMTGLGALTVFFLATLRPTRGILAELDPGVSWIARLRRLWFFLGVGIPTGLVLLSFLGYVFTSLQLAERLELTLALGFATVLLEALVVRALFLSQRKLAMERARQRRLQHAAQAESRPEGSADLPTEPDPVLDTATITLQTRQLLRIAFTLVVLLGAWGIWVDVLPALGVLREIELWSDGADPSTVVTLANLLLAIIITFTTFLAARNIPGLLHFVLLRRLQMPEGERLAITTLIRYGMVTIGIILAFSTIGVGWSKVQWLVAAVSLGLGFGLQEVFANFVSGVILLFERPIRVGDAVTVGDTLGRVSKMRIRATTLVDWDRRELIVPNKEFVTGRFTNWTLTDPITRITIPVGIAYGSDTAKAQELLLAVADACPVVLDEPKPRAIFRRFGESSLEFELRAFIRDLEDWPRLMNEVHMGIDQAFRGAGIEIAFPQRDLHLRTAPALAEYLGSRQPVPRSLPADQ